MENINWAGLGVDIDNMELDEINNYGIEIDEIKKDRVEISIELHQKGYNCAQAILGAFADIINIDEKLALKMAQPLGTGLGDMGEVCGAFNAMALVFGALMGSDIPKDKETKVKLYTKISDLANKFKNENGGLTCNILLGIGQIKQNPKKKPCVEYVRQCAKYIEKYLAEN